MTIEENEVMLPTNDYVFKKIFGQIGREEITKGLIEEIIGQKLNSIDLDKNTVLEKDLYDSKLGVLDIKATLDNDIVCNIEMQMTDKGNIEKRLLYYWSKLYTQQIKSGEKYKKLPKTIAILIANFELEQLKNIPKYYTKWQIREEEYQKIVLTDRLELYIIELPKTVYDVSKESNKKLMSWMKFLINPKSVEVVEMEENEELKKAWEVYEDINADEHERYLAELRIKYILDLEDIREKGLQEGYQQGIEEGREQGIEQGIERGIEQGIERGIEQGIERGMEQGIEQGMEQGIEQGEKAKSIEIAKKLLEKGNGIDEIVDITGLSEYEISALKE